MLSFIGSIIILVSTAAISFVVGAAVADETK